MILLIRLDLNVLDDKSVTIMRECLIALVDKMMTYQDENEFLHQNDASIF